MSQYPTRAYPPGPRDLPLGLSVDGYCVAGGCRYLPSEEDIQVAAEEGIDLQPHPRFAIQGADLCGYHVRRIQLVLTALIDITPHLEAALIRRAPVPITAATQDRITASTASAINPGARRGSGIRTVAEAWNPAAASSLYWIRDWTGFLIRTIQRERPVAEGADHGLPPFGRDSDVRFALDVIRRHHFRWLALYPTLGPGILQEGLMLLQRAKAAIDAPAVRRHVLAGRNCMHIEEVLENFGPIACGGQLVAILHDSDASARPSEIVCQRNPEHRIPRDEWMAHAG